MPELNAITVYTKFFTPSLFLLDHFLFPFPFTVLVTRFFHEITYIGNICWQGSGDIL
jgi:hypothetical protein